MCLEELVKEKKELLKIDIKSLHNFILRPIATRNIDIYGKENAVISDASHIPIYCSRVDCYLIKTING